MPTIFEDTFASVVSANWAKTDTGANLSVVGGRLFADGGLGSPAWGDPGLRYPPATTLARSTLGGFGAVVRLTNSGGNGPALALSPTAAPGVPSGAGGGVHFGYPDLWVSGVRVNPGLVGLRSVDYFLGTIPRPGGGYLVVAAQGMSGGGYAVFPQATLLWVEDAGDDANLYALLWGRDSVWLADHARVLDDAELPAALTTRFGAAVAADDFQRADGALSGSTPVGAKAYAVSGAPAISGGALSVPSGATFRFDPGVRCRWVELTVTAATAGFAFYFRNNGTAAASGFSLYCDPGETGLWNEGAGSGVQATTSTVWSSGAHRLRVLDEGTSVRLFLDDVDVLGAVAVSSYATQFGIGFTNYSGGAVTVDDVAAWPTALAVPASFGPFPSPPQGGGSALSADAFTAGDGTALPAYDAAWTVRSGTWEIATNRARMTASGVNGVATRGTGAAGADHEVRADILLPATTATYPTDWFAALFARWSAGTTWIMARYLYQNNSPEVEVWENNAGAQTLIGYVNLGVGVLAAGSTHTLRLAVRGDQVAAYHDGELVVQATTTVLTGADAGMGVADSLPHGQPAWDNLEIRATGATDTTPPVITAGPQATSITQTGATITWTTDEGADSQVEYGLTTGYGSQTALDTALVTSHSQPITGLTAGTLYHYRVKSRDAASNLATGTDNTFTTASSGGTAPVISAVATSNITQTAFTVTWTTDIASDSQVEYGTTVSYGSSTTLAPAMVTSHSVNVTGLTAGTLYHFRVRSATP